MADGLEDANVSDVVRVGEQHLIGEILNMTGGSASIQVYEETSGLGPGAEVVTHRYAAVRGARPRPASKTSMTASSVPLRGDPCICTGRNDHPRRERSGAEPQEDQWTLHAHAADGRRRARRRRRARHRPGDGLPSSTSIMVPPGDQDGALVKLDPRRRLHRSSRTIACLPLGERRRDAS